MREAVPTPRTDSQRILWSGSMKS
uniref:Uncharacterized protein n=1 Tax=Rhizophora mucronata TaxID=61149 RepID=A0A2P2JLD6_RHIMU